MYILEVFWNNFNVPSNFTCLQSHVEEKDRDREFGNGLISDTDSFYFDDENEYLYSYKQYSFFLISFDLFIENDK